MLGGQLRRRAEPRVRLGGAARHDDAGTCIRPTSASAAIALWEETRTKGNANRDDLHHRTRSGGVIPVFINSGLIEYGEQRFIQQICVDMSDRQRLEDQLIQSEKMAAIGQLAAGIAHEIRNPLAIIMNALYDLAEIVDGDNPEVREDLRIAKEEMDRVQTIINSLLEFSRDSRRRASRSSTSTTCSGRRCCS